jgi:prepilin-type N-terminal cleavage/methylation domain-containing protein
MKASSMKRMRKFTGGQQGFTLLEILVVLTIMGFLIAMVAPRLAMVGSDAVDTVCDTNQNRSVTYLSVYFQKTNGSLPNHLTNLVSYDGTTAAYTPEVSDEDPDDGNKGVFAEEFALRNNFSAHTLNAAEVAELAGLGIDTVFNLNDPEDAHTDAPFMEEAAIGEGTVVSMVGMGANSTSTTLVLTANNNVEGADSAVVEYGWGEPEKLGRIVFGLGPESDLVKDGIVSNAAHCPGGLQNSDNISYNDYNLVVPRLAATVKRLPTNIFGASTTNNQTIAIGYMDGDLVASSAGNYDAATNDGNFMKRTVKLAAQEAWEYQTQCPEGHVYPEAIDHWAIDLDGDGVIDGADQP